MLVWLHICIEPVHIYGITGVLSYQWHWSWSNDLPIHFSNPLSHQRFPLALTFILEFIQSSNCLNLLISALSIYPLISQSSKPIWRSHGQSCHPRIIFFPLWNNCQNYGSIVKHLPELLLQCGTLPELLFPWQKYCFTMEQPLFPPFTSLITHLGCSRAGPELLD